MHFHPLILFILTETQDNKKYLTDKCQLSETILKISKQHIFTIGDEPMKNKL